MKLGNSKGNNTGKKYHIRKRDEQKEPKPANQKRQRNLTNGLLKIISY